jgi:hypothetical protein
LPYLAWRGMTCPRCGFLAEDMDEVIHSWTKWFVHGRRGIAPPAPCNCERGLVIPPDEEGSHLMPWAHRDND